ncbi:MAG: hypothetical protein ACLFTT_01050 [Candidatus Hydrogenedentota bacterium]
MSSADEYRAAPECPEEPALTDFALGRAAEAVCQCIEAHVATCTDCAKRVAALRSEADGLRALFARAAEGHGADQIDDQALAAYLDGTEDAEARAAMERRLAGNSAALAALVRLYRDTREAWRGDTNPPEVEARPAGEQIALEETQAARKRNRHANESNAGPAKSKDQNGEDPEKRKGRFVSGQS